MTRQVTVLLVSLAFWLVDALLQALLFFAPSAYGAPYMADTVANFFRGLWYSGGVFMFLTIPFMVAAMFKRPSTRILYLVEVVVMFMTGFLIYADHEVMRFYGAHYSLQMMTTYNLSGDASDFVIRTLRNDARFPYSSLILGIIPIAFLGLTVVLHKKILGVIERVCSKAHSLLARAPERAQKLVPAVVLCAIPVIWPTTCALAFVKTDPLYGTVKVQASRPQLKVSPIHIALIHDIRAMSNGASADYSDISERIARVRQMWLDAETDSNWVYADPAKPLLRHHNGACVTRETKPNIVVILLESWRGLNMPDFNGDVTEDPMPFMHSMINQTAPILKKHNLHTAWFPYYQTNGQPTIDAFMAFNTGLPPHSLLNVASTFTRDNLNSFVVTLRDHGYWSMFINSCNGSFDSQPAWLARWYDAVMDLQTWDDRVTLGTMSDQIIKAKNAGKPFVVNALTISNHVPFKVPDGAWPQVPSDARYADRMKYTLRFDDGELENFFNRLGEAGALGNTLFIITGDHGYDFGEYQAKDRVQTGHDAVRANVTWVPMVMISDLDFVPSGRQDITASHVDLTPTIFDAAGVCDDTNSLGHSLLNPSPKSVENRTAVDCKNGNYQFSTSEHTAIIVHDEPPLLFGRGDRIQRHDIARDNPDILNGMKSKAEDLRRVLDYCYENNLF